MKQIQQMASSDAPRDASDAHVETDAALLARSITTPEAFRSLFARHHDAVHRYTAARIGAERAEDVTADTFVAAYTNRARFDPTRGTSALPWLLGIATRRIGRHRDAERRWLRSRAAAWDVGSAHAPARMEEGAIAARLDAQQLAPAIADALAALRSRERDPLLLHALGNLSYEQISAALDIPIGTVRSRIARARTRLAGILDGARP